MVVVPLNESRIAAGRTLLKELDLDGVKVDAALWYYFSDKENWKLVLSLPDLIPNGPKAAYQEVQRVLLAAEPPIGIELADITVARPNSDPINLFRGVFRTKPDAIGQNRFTQCVFNGQLIEDALVYRLVPAGNGSRAKRKA